MDDEMRNYITFILKSNLIKMELEFKETPNQLSSYHEDQNQEYCTNINELIAEPDLPSKTQVFLSSIYNLSLYLFKKKTNQQPQIEEDISFDGYLNSVGNEFMKYQNLHKRSKQILMKANQYAGGGNESQLVQCYRRVPFLFFQENFVLDFGDLSKENKEVRKKQELLNEQLDLVEINLFTQIHYKFHDYFNAVTNFDYLSQSIAVNLQKVNESRKRMAHVKSDIVDKSQLLRKKIIHRQNLQKTIKMVKIAKSLKKLPAVINQILTSSLPYQCLSLLKSTKQSLSQVQALQCLTKTSKLLNESENMVQIGLNKRYGDELYMYLQQCQNINLCESWQKINSQNCMDISGMNNSMMSSSTILEQSILDMQVNNYSRVRRNQGKEFEIAMIVLQSYKYIQFPQDLTRIKITNSLRIYLKKFDQELAKWLTQLLLNKFNTLQLNNSAVQSFKQESNNAIQCTLNSDLVEKVTVVFYVKHIYIINQIMKETLNRLLGFFQTLVAEYEESEEKNQEKFISFLKQQFTSFTAITKIAIQKIKLLMQLKNINGIGLQQFKQWLGLIQYWDKYVDNLIEEHPLINYDGKNDQIENLINESLRKMISILNIKATVNELSLSFVTVYHSNIVNCELHNSLIEQSWQSVEIPGQFIEILNNISLWKDTNVSQNISITILNDSGQLNISNRSLSMSQDIQKKTSSKFRIIKNNILVDGNRYKVSVSFLLLCEFIDEYIKMAKSLSCQKFVYERMFDLIENYNNKSRELILEAQARKYEKMKGKNISAKYLCLVHNCLTLLQKLLQQMKKPQMDELREIAVTTIQIHRKKIIEKLQNLLRGKIQITIISYLQEKSKSSQTNMTLLNTFIQMMGIIDEYLDIDEKKTIFKQSIDTFIKKYFKQLLLKGPEMTNQNKILVQKLSFLKQYFPEELELMEKQISKIQKK